MKRIPSATTKSEGYDHHHHHKMGYYKTTLPILISEIDLDSEPDDDAESEESHSSLNGIVVMDGDLEKNQSDDSEGLYSNTTGTGTGTNTRLMKRERGGSSIVYAHI